MTVTPAGGTTASTSFLPEYGLDGDPAVLDAWGRPIVIQVPPSDPSYARLVSAGPNGVIDTPESVLMPTAGGTSPTNERGDDVIMFLFQPDQYAQGVPSLGQ